MPLSDGLVYASRYETIQAAIDAAYSAGGGVVYVDPGKVYMSGPLTLKYGVSLKGAAPVPYMDAVSPLGMFSTIRLSAGSNASLLTNDRQNGPIQQGSQRWQRSTIENIHFDVAGHQQSGDCHGIDIEDAWGVNIAGCQVSRPRGHAFRMVNVNAVNLWRSHADGTGSPSGSHCLHIEDAADCDFGEGCQMGGSPGSVVYVSKRDAGPEYNRSWLFKIRDGFFFNSTAGHGIEIDNCDDAYGIQVTNNRVDQNYLHGISVVNSPDCILMGNVGYDNGKNNDTPHEDFLVDASRTVVVGNVGTVKEV